MNQEQNNMNQNNFNMQDNNGISNSQPLNNMNQDFNNVSNSHLQQNSGSQQIMPQNIQSQSSIEFLNVNNDTQDLNNNIYQNQSMQQNVNVNPSTFNHQSINQQTQTSPNFYQPINQMNIQQPTPLHENTFERGVANNQGKPPKKQNLGLIIGIIVAIVVGGVGLVFGIKKISNNFNEESSNNNSNTIKAQQVKITGKIKKIKSFEGYTDASTCGNYYFTLQKEEEMVVVDADGRILGSGGTKYEPYCHDDGTVIFAEDNVENRNKIYSIWRNNKKIYSFECYKDSFNFYDNNVIYHSVDSYHGIKAYDLENGKELWSSSELGSSPVALENFVYYESWYNNSQILLDKKTGKVILKPEENMEIYVSQPNYYIKIYKIEETDWIKNLEVFDFDNNLISKLNIESNNKCAFQKALSNGYYIISCKIDLTSSNHRLYDRNSNLVKEVSYHNYEVLKPGKYGDMLSRNDLFNPNVSVFTSSNSSLPNFILYEDGTIVNHYDIPTSNDNSKIREIAYGKNSYQKVFVIGMDRDNSSDSKYKLTLTNLLTKKQEAIGTIELYESIYSYPLFGNQYYTITQNKISSFYDVELNKLEYETETPFVSISNEWILLYKTNYIGGLIEDEFYIVNILTKEEYKIDLEIDNKTDGFHQRILYNHSGILTKKNNSYNLYKYN